MSTDVRNWIQANPLGNSKSPLLEEQQRQLSMERESRMDTIERYDALKGHSFP